MIINELKLKGFKQFRDTVITLGPGLTILMGGNEAGKSTLLEALLAVLFASPKSRAKGVEEWITWGAAERPDVSLRYAVDGVEFRLDKDFEAGTVSLENMSTGESLTDEKRVHATVADQLGVGSRDLFLGTVCVRHDELAGIATGAGEIKDRLQKVLTGGQDVSARKMLKALEDRIAEINRGMDRPAAKPGIRRSLVDKMETLAHRDSETRGEAQRHRRAAESLTRIDEEVSGIQAALRSKKDLLDKNRRFLEGSTRLESLGKEFREIESRLSRIREIEEDRARASSRGANLAVFATVPDALAEIARIDGVIEEFRHAEGLEMGRFSTAPAPRRGVARTLAGIAGVVLLAAGAWFGYAVNPLYYLLAAVGAALVGYTIAKGVSGAEDDIQGLVRMRAEEMHARATTAEAERRKVLDRYGVASLSELQERYRLYQEAASGHDRFDGEVQGLLAGRTRESLAGERTELARKIAADEQSLSEGLRQTALSPHEFHELGEEVKRMEQRLASLAESRIQERLALESTRDAAEGLLLAEEFLEGARQDLSRVEHRLSVYEKAAGGMDEAIRSTLSSAREILERELAGHMVRITGGRYDCVSVAEEDLSLSLYSMERGGPVSTAQLSKGTMDQLYLSARLGLVNVLFGEKRPPIILDDPLAGFDDNRLAGAMEVLDEYAAERQVVLLTCHDRYSRFGGSVVRL